MAKRASVAGAPAAKKQRSVLKQCTSIQTALLSAENVPAPVLDMLGGHLEHVFPPKEQRHGFQDSVIKMIGTVLDGIDAATKAKISDAEKKLQKSGEEKDVREKRHQDAAAAVTTKAQAAEVAKIALGEGDSAAKAGKTAVSDAEEAQATGDFESYDAERKRARLEKLRSDNFLPLKDGVADLAPNLKKKNLNALLKFCKDNDLDASMITSLPAAIDKPAADRTTFDNMVVDNMESEIAKLIKVQEDALAAAEPGKAERAKAVDTAQTAYAAVEQEAEARKAAFEQSKTEFETAKSEHKEAAKAVAQFGPEMKQVQKDLEARQAEYTAFSEGAMAAYKELVDYTAVAPAAADGQA